MRLKKLNQGKQLARTESEAHVEFETDVEQDQATREKRIEWVSMMLNLAYKEDGIDGLTDNGWVDAIVSSARAVGIHNASAEMLIERFQNEGHIQLERDMQRLEQRVGAVAVNTPLTLSSETTSDATWDAGTVEVAK